MKRFFVAARQIFFSEATDQDTSVFCTGVFLNNFLHISIKDIFYAIMILKLCHIQLSYHMKSAILIK